MSTKETGVKGERIAIRFCVSLGMRIIKRNWRHGRGEIDIIAQDESELVFIEVKYRTSTTFGYPEESVTKHKQHILVQTIRAYLSEHPTKKFRVDVLSILKNGEKTTLRHLRDIELVS